MRRQLGVRTTLVLLVVLLTLPIAGLIVQTSISEQEKAIEHAKVHLQVQAQLLAHGQEQLFESVRHMLKVISHSDQMREPRSPECNRYLRELNAFFPGYAHLSFADTQGNLVCRSSSSPGQFYVGDRKYFNDAARSGKFTVGEYLVSRITGKPSIALSIPVHQPNGELHGVLYAVRELALIQAQLDELPSTTGVTDLVTDADGTVLASSGERPLPAGKRLSEGFLARAISKRLEAVARDLDDAGQEWWYAVHPVNVEGTGGLLVASVASTDSILRPTIQRLQRQLLILVGIALAAVALAWHLGDHVLAEPIRQLLAKVQALERGDTALPQPDGTALLQVRELGQIGSGIDDLARVLAARASQRDQALAEIQEQKRAIEASERRYRAQFEASPQPMWVFDAETLAFLIVNDAAVTHYGYSREEFMAMSLADIVVPQDMPLVAESLRQHETRPAAEILRRHRRRNGETIDVEISTQPLNWDGRPARMVIVYDVTSRELAKLAWKTLHQTLEQKVAQRTRELELANEELEAFSYSVSHDLRAPVHAIDGYCGNLADKYGSELPTQASHWIQRIRAGTRQINALIEDLLSLSRTGRMPLELQEVDLASLARATVNQLRQSFPDRQISVEVQAPLPVRCDPGLLAVLMDNLVGNAWKFTEGTPQATIHVGSAGATPEGMVFFVSDNGAGFDMAFADKLFKPFQRLHSVAEFEGTGIGLAIVHRVIQRHRGRVWAESTVQKGATFFFVLPAEAPKASMEVTTASVLDA